MYRGVIAYRQQPPKKPEALPSRLSSCKDSEPQQPEQLPADCSSCQQDLAPTRANPPPGLDGGLELKAQVSKEPAAKEGPSPLEGLELKAQVSQEPAAKEGPVGNEMPQQVSQEVEASQATTEITATPQKPCATSAACNPQPEAAKPKYPGAVYMALNRLSSFQLEDCGSNKLLLVSEAHLQQ